jgi:L-fuculose-phosphate aldolase
MENHGTVVGGKNIFRAFQRFETLEFCARSIINANILGEAHYLTDDEIRVFEEQDVELPEMIEVSYSTKEKELRNLIYQFVKRACDQNLMISTHGTVSIRLKENDFLITPTGVNRRFLGHGDIVQIKNGKREPGKLPSKSTKLHQEIYKHNPHINSIIITQSPHVMGFAISHKKFDTRTIPESYILLKDIPMIEFGKHISQMANVAKSLNKETPIVIIKNDSVIVTGNSLLETFDRLEVAEFSAKSLIQTKSIGEVVSIGDKEIDDLTRKFLL